MNEQKLVTGDKVKLNTGENGLPVMAINSWYNSEVATCVWYDAATNEYKQRNFNVSTLVKIG